MEPEGVFTTRPREVRTGAGLIQSITGPAPRAGAEISWTVPSGVELRLQALRFTLTTSAVGVDRRVDLVIDDGAAVILRVEPTALQSGAQTLGYNYAPALAPRTPLVAECSMPLPVELILEAGWRVRTQTADLQPDDQFSAPQIGVEQWLAS